MHCVLLDRNNWIGYCGIHLLHSLDLNPEALHHIASVFTALSLAFSAAVWPTVAGCVTPHWPHDLQALAQPPESPSGLSLALGLHLALQPHCAPYWNDAYRRLQQ